MTTGKRKAENMRIRLRWAHNKPTLYKEVFDNYFIFQHLCKLYDDILYNGYFLCAANFY